MGSTEKTLEISFEWDMPAIAAPREEYVIPMPAISRRTFLAGGTAVRAGLLLGQVAGAESFGSGDTPPLRTPVAALPCLDRSGRTSNRRS